MLKITYFLNLLDRKTFLVIFVLQYCEIGHYLEIILKVWYTLNQF